MGALCIVKSLTILCSLYIFLGKFLPKIRSAVVKAHILFNSWGLPNLFTKIKITDETKKVPSNAKF